jgi:hypothetical protein
MNKAHRCIKKSLHRTHKKQMPRLGHPEGGQLEKKQKVLLVQFVIEKDRRPP